MYEQLYPRVLGFALRRVSVEQARDVVDETFLIAWRRRSDLPEQPLPWLLVTARNTILDTARRAQRQDAIAMELARCQRRDTTSGTEAAVVERIAVFQALAALPDHEREALIMTGWDGLSYRHAASVAGCSVPTFTVRVHRARRRLAAVLDDVDGAQAGSSPMRHGSAEGMLRMNSRKVDNE